MGQDQRRGTLNTQADGSLLPLVGPSPASIRLDRAEFDNPAFFFLPDHRSMPTTPTCSLSCQLVPFDLRCIRDKALSERGRQNEFANVACCAELGSAAINHVTSKWRWAPHLRASGVTCLSGNRYESCYSKVIHLLSSRSLGPLRSIVIASPHFRGRKRTAATAMLWDHMIALLQHHLYGCTCALLSWLQDE